MSDPGHTWDFDAKQVDVPRQSDIQLGNRAELGLSLLGFAQDAFGELYVLGNATGTPFEESGVVLKMIPSTPTAE